MAFTVVDVDGAGVVSTGNSSSTPLGSSGVFTGTGEDVSRYAQLAITVYASHASATEGLSVQFSANGTDWDHIDTFTVPAATGKVFTVGVIAQYFRLVYTNGTTAQSSFRLQALYHVFPFKPSSHALDSTLSNTDDAELVRAVISGRDPVLGSFHNVEVIKSTGPTGRVGVDLTGQSISIGAPVPENPTNIVRQKLLNGSSPSMRVNGSVTPVSFVFNADPTNDVKIGEIRLVFSDNAIDMNGASFGSSGTLTNGCLLEVQASGSLVTLTNVTLNEDFLSFPGGLPFLDRSGVQDVLAVSYSLGGAVKLIGGTSDFVRMTIRDNLTAVNFKLFQGTVYGVKVE